MPTMLKKQDPVEGLGQYYKSIMMKKSLGNWESR